MIPCFLSKSVGLQTLHYPKPNSFAQCNCPSSILLLYHTVNVCRIHFFNLMQHQSSPTACSVGNHSHRFHASRNVATEIGLVITSASF